jgi:hypothetical protein
MNGVCVDIGAYPAIPVLGAQTLLRLLRSRLMSDDRYSSIMAMLPATTATMAIIITLNLNLSFNAFLPNVSAKNGFNFLYETFPKLQFLEKLPLFKTGLLDSFS